MFLINILNNTWGGPLSQRFLLLFASVFSLLFVPAAQALSLTVGAEDSLYQYLLEQPEQIGQVLHRIDKDDSLTLSQKQAYRALIGADSELSGDAVLEQIPTEELAAFYGWDYPGDNEVGDSKLHNSAIITDSLNEGHYQTCLSTPLCVMVSKNSQRLYAFFNGRQFQLNDAPRGQQNSFPFAQISTARSGKWTPVGIFTVDELAGANRVSGLYGGAALYYAMQLNGHIFIHATSTDNYGALGTPASAGCIRTRFGVAEQLNALMREIGGREPETGWGVLRDKETVRVIVANSIPNNFLTTY
jgi:hypothetical protein